MPATSRTTRFVAAVASAAITLGIVVGMTGLAGHVQAVELAKATSQKPVLVAIVAR